MRSESRDPEDRNAGRNEEDNGPREAPDPGEAETVELKPLPTWRAGGPLVDISDRDALYRVMEEE
jgi:hypothetical protein